MNDLRKEGYFKYIHKATASNPDNNDGDVTDDGVLSKAAIDNYFQSVMDPLSFPSHDEELSVFKANGSLDDRDISTSHHSRLTRSEPVDCEDFACDCGTVVALATAFIVKFDQNDTIPAHWEGCLKPYSTNDIWQYHEHLIAEHLEIEYLLGKDVADWEYKPVVCSEPTINHAATLHVF